MLQETKVIKARLKDIIGRMRSKYEVVVLDARGNVVGITILWNPSEILFHEWCIMPHILLGRFRHIGTSNCEVLPVVYDPHILGEKEAFL